MEMKVVYMDGQWFIGNRTWITSHDETKGTHHYIVLNGDEYFNKLIGKEVAVPINAVKYFELNYKRNKDAKN